MYYELIKCLWNGYTSIIKKTPSESVTLQEINVLIFQDKSDIAVGLKVDLTHMSISHGWHINHKYMSAISSESLCFRILNYCLFCLSFNIYDSFIHHDILWPNEVVNTSHHASKILATHINWFNTLRPGHDGCQFPDDIFKYNFLNENVWISIEISLKFVLKGPINNIPALVQVMAWHRPGDKPLSEPMMISLPTHICVTRPQWVNISP